MKRGDIYYADLSPVVGSEQGGVRPVLIVQNDTGNRYSPTVTIRIKKADEETYSVDVTVQISKTFFAWIVGTQGKVKIKSPRKVIDEFNEFVAKIKEEY